MPEIVATPIVEETQEHGCRRRREGSIINLRKNAGRCRRGLTFCAVAYSAPRRAPALLRGKGP